MKRFLFFLFFILLFERGISVAIPQKLEDIIIREREFQTDFILSYNNISFSNLADQEVISQNVLYYVLNLRYDITSRLEVFLFGSYSSNFIKSIQEKKSKISRTSFHNIGPSGLGFSLEVLKESTHPSLTVSLLTNVYDRLVIGGESKTAWFDSYSLYLSSYYTIDPVVLFLTLMYRYNSDIKFDDKEFNYGDTFFISPQFYFLANPFVSINVGFRYIYQGKDRLNGDVIMFERSMVSFLIGLTYELKDGFFVSIDSEFRQRSDYSHSIINIRTTFRF